MYEAGRCADGCAPFSEFLVRRRLDQPLKISVAADGDLQVGHQAIGQGVDPTMHLQRLTPRPGVVDKHVHGDIANLADHIQFAQSIQALRFGRDGVKRGAVFVIDLADRVQPMIDEPQPPPIHGRADPAATIVADHQDMLDLDHIDRELQDRQVVGVLRRSEIGDIAMDEQLAWIETDNLIGRHPAVGATDPQVVRGLLARQPLEKARVLSDLALGPSTIVVFEVVKHGQGLRAKSGPMASQPVVEP